MSAISDAADKQNVAFGRVDVALKTISDAIASGAPSPADQAILDTQVKRSEDTATAVEAVATSVTPPPPPTP